MRKATAWVLFGLAVATGAGAQPDGNSQGLPRVPLSEKFLPETHLRADWDVMEEAPEAIDPELRRQGLVDTSTRHYTQSFGRVSIVCSVELWQFGQAWSARGVASAMEMPHWQVLRSGSLLVLTHGVRLELGLPSSARLQKDCAELGRLTHERIARGR